MSNSQNPELKGIEKGVVFYANASWLRTTIVGAAGAVGILAPAIPAIVGAVDVALTIKAQKIAERRLNVLCQSWEQEIQSVPKDLVDKDYIESEEFFDLIFQAWESTKRTRHDEKICLYAKLLVGTVPFQNRQDHFPEDYMTVLTELSVKEISLAQALFKQQRERPKPDENEMQWLKRIGATEKREAKGQRLKDGHGQWRKLLLDCSKVNEEDIEFVLLRLQRSGLLTELSGTYLGYSGGVYVINDTFRKMMHYIERSERPTP